MKINLFIDCLGAGGAQRQLVGLAIMLYKRGYNAKVSYYYSLDFYKQDLDYAGVPNELIPNAGNTKKRIWVVRNYFKKEKPDWVIAYQETPSLVACAAKILGCKFKLIVSERNTTQTLRKEDRIRFFLYHWANYVVPNSYTQEKFLREHYSWMKSRIRTITNFVDLEKFYPYYHSLDSKVKVLIVATIRESKNTLGFLEAVKLLKREGVDVYFEWYGISMEFEDYYNKCIKYISENNLSDYIVLKTKTKYISDVYRKTDIFCLPSFYEGTPNSLCEAIASGLPVVASNVCDNGHYIINGRNGMLFDPKSPNNISQTFMTLLEIIRQNNYERFQCESRKLAEEKLDCTLFVKQYLAMLNNK